MNSPCSPEETPSRVARSATRYQSCVVDPRPGRAVHCPDLNACLVNEGRPVPVDCRAVHFGYAIPVTVVPLPDEPDLAELVLDPSPDLTPQAVSYLLHHHPHFRQERLNGDMAATAKHEHMRGGGKFTGEPEEDIAAIAKQISDHAEAIYQTWKSRGLAPTEIMTCHSNATAADKFGTALMPQSSSPQPKLFPVKASQPPPVVDLSLDANNLERLVNNFVSEDKARLAAARQHKSVPSSIQYARQKFEKQLPEPQSSSPPSSSFVKPHHLDQLHAKTQPSHHLKTLQSPSKIPTSVTSNIGQYPHPVRNTSAQSHVSTAPLSRHVQLETIETTYPMDVTAVHKVQQLKKTVDVTENNPSSGLTTWPLKNKNLGVGIDKRVSSSKTPASNKDEATKRRSIGEEPSGKQFSSLSTNNKNTAEYLDEVAREEERLINALKTGIIIAEERVGDPGVSPSKKSNLLLKKSSKDKVTGGVKKEKSGDKLPSSIQPETTSTLSTRAVPGRTSASPKTQTPAVTQQKSSIKEVDKSSLSTLSTVDYAKIRYHAAQQNPRTQQRLETAKHLEQPKTGAATVPVARTRFEAVEEGGWRPAVGGRTRHPALESVPHPELTTQQRQHIRANSVSGVGVNPVRPFLTRGSVAERVLIFEKCPTELLLDKRRGAPAMSTWRTGHEVHTRAQTYSRDKENQRPVGHLPPNTTLQRHVRSNRNVHIPRFYYPQGKPTSEHQMEVALKKISAVFHQFPNQQVVKDKFHLVTKACDCPLYWKMPLFAATGGEKLGHVESNTFLDFWKRLLLSCHDQASWFIHILTRGLRDHLTPDDLGAMVQDVVDSHPGLTFLKEATEFHSRYVHTVIARIFYCVNRSWSGRISLPELRRSNLLRVIQLLEEEEDINQVTSYFSYEHFYVIYCRFWELDRDHDLFIDRQDLHRHSEHALSTRIIERIFSGAVTRGARQQSDKMSYTEFVWFLLSEEDKTHPTAIEYWFRCMDLDGDGYLSMYELEYFYEEQLQRMEAIGIETLPFEDCLCQMLDMIHPATPGKISLSDLKQCKMTSIFFDTFFNLEKYLDHEQRDPFASQREHDTDGQELSDWDRYAAEEYELLVAEEGSNDQQEDMLYEDDTEGEDALSPNLDNIITNNNDSESKVDHWKNPSFTVTDFDMDDEDNDSADYAADSDDCSL